MNPYALLALLLQYPDTEILEARETIAVAVRALPQSCLRSEPLNRFLDWWVETPVYTLQSAYVDTFDLGRRCALHLTYPLFGDRRERGMALLRLKHRYGTCGFSLIGTELPDYLPLMLEYAAADPDGEALLAEHRISLELLRAALHDAASAYGAVVDVLCGLLGTLTEEERAQVERIAAEGPPMETVGLEPFAPPDVMPAMHGEVRR
ncbi:MAG: nitrate reductase molybdenum cofactor assembly chaperone [Candidatus Dormibacteraeota bacterium]|nr:nitrate reductase molybdenum cofactor assembly chaperone [Candidatus Dormibacteraeota bacterium]